MCSTCGCDANGSVLIRKVEAGELQSDSLQFHAVPDKPSKARVNRYDEEKHERHVHLEEEILGKNQRIADRNRALFGNRKIFALNLVSSPGSGKTSLLENTLTDLSHDNRFYVIEGDQQTSNDGERIAATGAEVVQINTGKGCHLDADMISRAVEQLNPVEGSTLFIENVGNLVCPSMFDLGETLRVVVISVTEGEDKPLKYPDMFATSDLCIINKIDLLPYLKFDVEKLKTFARRVNPYMQFIETSCMSGKGLVEWYLWLKQYSHSQEPFLLEQEVYE
jgi:hydrogenase nickel incorporation protein HypB